MTASLEYDFREWNQAVGLYAAASGKDHKDVSNKKLFDVGLRSVKHTVKGSKAAVRALLGERKFIDWLMWYVFVPKGMTRKQGVAAARRLIRRRGKAVGFTKSFFVRLAAAVRPYLPQDVKMRGTGGKGLVGGFKAHVIPATDTTPNAEATIQYEYKRRSRATAQVTEKFLADALQGGIRDTIRDIEKYAQRKMRKTAKKFSAR